jgi:hypothetical protein
MLWSSGMSDDWDDWYDIQQYRCLERDTALHGINPAKAGTFWAVQIPQTSSASLNRPLRPEPLVLTVTQTGLSTQCCSDYVLIIRGP